MFEKGYESLVLGSLTSLVSCPITKRTPKLTSRDLKMSAKGLNPQALMQSSLERNLKAKRETKTNKIEEKMC